MKRVPHVPVIVVLAFNVCIIAAHAQQRIDVQMQVDSVKREFIISVPSGSVPLGGYPLVFMFHGTSQDGEKFYQDSQWKEKGEAEKFIAVFPTALGYCIEEDGRQRTTTKWHNGELEEIACPGQYLKDDRNFVRAMIDSIAARVAIDRRRIYASGFSNGGGFTSKLAVEMSDVFAAVGVCGGALSDGDSARAVNPIPFWFVLGTLDDKWLKPYESFGITEFPFNDSTLVMMNRPIRRILDCFNLSETFTRTEAGRVINYLFDTPADPSEGSTEFRFTLIDNMYHVYPDGTNVPFVAADHFWEFFSKYQVPVRVENVPARSDIPAVYPNPARDHLVVAGEGRAQVILRNILGQEVFRADGMLGVPYRLPKLIRGIYVAEIRSASEHFLRTVAIQ